MAEGGEREQTGNIVETLSSVVEGGEQSEGTEEQRGKRRSRMDVIVFLIVIRGGTDRTRILLHRQSRLDDFLSPFSATAIDLLFPFYFSVSFFFLFLFFLYAHQSTRPLSPNVCVPAPLLGTCRPTARRLSMPYPPISGHPTHVTTRGVSSLSALQQPLAACWPSHIFFQIDPPPPPSSTRV